jgi:hypothetical protein
MKNREEIIEKIAATEVDNMELDALIDFYISERMANLHDVDDDTIQNIADELGIEEERSEWL